MLLQIRNEGVRAGGNGAHEDHERHRLEVLQVDPGPSLSTGRQIGDGSPLIGDVVGLAEMLSHVLPSFLRPTEGVYCPSGRPGLGFNAHRAFMRIQKGKPPNRTCSVVTRQPSRTATAWSWSRYAG